MTIAEPIRRTSEIEEVTNLYVIHPISNRLVPLFASLGITPNVVSIAGMILGLLAGVAYHHYEATRWAFTGFVLMIAWHVMDGADGQLARLTHAQSRTGKILDGICDYVTFISVYIGLARALVPGHGGGIWLLVVLSGVCHAVQSAAYEVQRQEYDFWGKGKQSAELLRMTASQDAPANGLFELIYRLYVRVQLVATGVTPAFHRRLAGMLAQQPDETEAFRARYRAFFAPSVRRWSIMAANYRTIGLFLFALAKVPEYYFWFEMIGLSAIMILLLRRRHADYARFFREVEGDA
jgi:phosphatidylglycerophosphate synthase